MFRFVQVLIGIPFAATVLILFYFATIFLNKEIK
jgi:hypothetical protein